MALFPGTSAGRSILKTGGALALLQPPLNHQKETLTAVAVIHRGLQDALLHPLERKDQLLISQQ